MFPSAPNTNNALKYENPKDWLKQVMHETEIQLGHNSTQTTHTFAQTLETK